MLPDAGGVSREEADKKAGQEYELFSARRRAQLEAEAERDSMKELDAAIRKLPKRDQPHE